MPQISDLLDQELPRDWFIVDEFEGPGANSDGNLFTVRLLAECEETPQSDMSEGADDVGEDFDDAWGFDAVHGCPDMSWTIATTGRAGHCTYTLGGIG